MRVEDKPAAADVWRYLDQHTWHGWLGFRVIRHGVRRENLMQISRPLYVAIRETIERLP